MDPVRCGRLAIFLVFALLSTRASAAQAQKAKPAVVLPDTPAGRRISAFLAAFNSGETIRLERFFREVTDPRSPSPRSPAERAIRLEAIHREMGALSVRRMNRPDDHTIDIIVAGTKGQLLRFGFRLSPEPDCWLESLTFDEADPEDLEGPPPPMSEPEALEAIVRAVNQAAAADDFSGTVLVARGTKKLLLKAWGLASMEFNVPNRTDTKFNLGSINKIFTKVAIGQLLEQGKLSLDDPLGKYIPDYSNREAAARVKIRHLVDMQSGIGDFFGPRFDATPKDAFRRNESFLSMFADQPLQFEPGTQRRYSNGGYVVLGEIVARASGRDYYDYVRESIFARAGMADTDSFEADVPVASLAEGYTRSWDGTDRSTGPRRKNIYSRPARGSAAGGGYSTAEDLLRFTDALLADRLLSYPYTEWVLSGADPEQVKKTAAAPRTHGGQGLAGGAPGINAFLEVDLGTGYTVVVLSNYDPPAAMDIARKISRMIRAVRK